MASTSAIRASAAGILSANRTELRRPIQVLRVDLCARFKGGAILETRLWLNLLQPQLSQDWFKLS
jgi:hypothetical protein